MRDKERKRALEDRYRHRKVRNEKKKGITNQNANVGALLPKNTRRTVMIITHRFPPSSLPLTAGV
jgi:hypothetical protein